MSVAATTALGLAAAWALAVSAWDLASRRIPWALALSGVVPLVAAGLVTGRWAALALGAVATAGLYLLVRLVAPAAVGGGDLRLAPVCGGLAGLGGVESWLVATAGAVLLTGVVAALVVAVAAVRRSPRPAAVPHGPSMVLPAVLVLVPALA